MAPSGRMDWAERFRQRQLVRSSMWVLPSCYVAAALVGGVVAPRLDRELAVRSSWLPEPDNARAILSAIGTGMITLTGFVFSFLLLLVQFGSTAFTPRLNRILRRDWVVKHALGAFTGTFMFSLTALLAVDRLEPGTVPAATIALLGVLLLLSLGLFFAMISRVADGLRVSRVIHQLALNGHRVLDDVYPDAFPEASSVATPRAGDDPRAGGDRRPVQVVTHTGQAAVVVAVDRAGLADVAGRARVAIEVVPAVGDDVAQGAELFRVYGDHPVPERRLRSAVVLGDERTVEGDPAFALRLLVDIAIRALSPAVNDPTTAVGALDAIAGLLGHAAVKRLDIGVVADGDDVSVTCPAPTWADLLQLATTEIRLYGRDSVQVTRRLRALFETLLRVAPPARHAAVRDELARLQETVAHAHGAEGDRRLALVADAQGIGPTRHAP